MTSAVVAADEIPWRPAMENVLRVLATEGRARTVAMIRSHTGLGEQAIRNALADLVHKGLATCQPGCPAWYRINDHGKRTVARNPERFRL